MTCTWWRRDFSIAVIIPPIRYTVSPCQVDVKFTEFFLRLQSTNLSLKRNPVYSIDLCGIRNLLSAIKSKFYFYACRRWGFTYIYIRCSLFLSVFVRQLNVFFSLSSRWIFSSPGKSFRLWNVLLNFRGKVSKGYQDDIIYFYYIFITTKTLCTSLVFIQMECNTSPS